MANFEKSKYDEIESYLNKTMTSDKRQKFEEEMKTNKDLANEVRAQEFDRAFEFLSIKADVKEMFGKLKAETVVEPTPMWVVFVRKPYFKTMVAAIVIILSVIGIWQIKGPVILGLFKGSDTTKTNPPQPNRQPDNSPLPELKPSVSEKIDQLAQLSKQAKRKGLPKDLNEAISAYDRADSDDTLAVQRIAVLFDRVQSPLPPDSTPIDSTVFGANGENKGNKPNAKTESYRLLYQGLIFLNTGEYDKSIGKFNQVNGSLKEEARFYTALAYLKNNNTTKGRELLNEIIKNAKDDSFKTQAQELLTLLDEKE